MTADAAVGLFALACVTVSTIAWLIIAGAWRLWPFRDEEETVDACRGCGAEIDPDSLKRTCGALECDSWSEHPWSGESRHGDDGNSGHG